MIKEWKRPNKSLNYMSANATDLFFCLVTSAVQIFFNRDRSFGLPTYYLSLSPYHIPVLECFFAYNENVHFQVRIFILSLSLSLSLFLFLSHSYLRAQHLTMCT